MSQSETCKEAKSSSILYPALAVAALAGIAATYFLTKRSRAMAGAAPIESVIDVCSSAAAKLDALVAQAS
jgi:hypothetical protein